MKKAYWFIGGLLLGAALAFGIPMLLPKKAKDKKA